MAIKYLDAPDVRKRAEDIIRVLNWSHISLENVGFVRSIGSKSRRVIARCHSLGKAMQIALQRSKGFYLIEVISERFDKLPEDEKTKVVIHELMHIPKSFGGGFIQHNMVNEKSVQRIYEKYLNMSSFFKNEY